MRRLFVLLVVCGMFLGPVTSFASFNQGSAKSYLLAHAENPWSTIGLSALGASSIPSDYLKTITGTTAIEYAAPILALTSLNFDPRTFGTQDYVAALKSYDNNNQLGDPTTVNDDIFGLLALISAGEPTADSVITDAENFILANQQANGGWGFSVSGGTDSNMTSAAIVALVAAGVSPSDSVIQNALDYLKTTQNDDGGFTYDPSSPWGTDSDSSSTSWVMWALDAAGIKQSTWSKSGHSPANYLESNQDATGFFKYQSSSSEDSFSAATSTYAVIALSGKTLPLNIFQPPVVTFTLTYTAGPNGTISGTTSQIVNSSADGTAVVAKPAINYHFDKWSDGLTTASRTDTNVTANIDVTAEFAMNAGSSGGGGFVSTPAPVPTPVTPSPSPDSSSPAPAPTPVGLVLGAKTFNEGSLLKTADSPTVYIVMNGRLRPFSSEKIFLAYGLKFSDVQITDSSAFTSEQVGSIMDYPGGTPHE